MLCIGEAAALRWCSRTLESHVHTHMYIKQYIDTYVCVYLSISRHNYLDGVVCVVSFVRYAVRECCLCVTRCPLPPSPPPPLPPLLLTLAVISRKRAPEHRMHVICSTVPWAFECLRQDVPFVRDCARAGWCSFFSFFFFCCFCSFVLVLRMHAYTREYANARVRKRNARSHAHALSVLYYNHYVGCVHLCESGTMCVTNKCRILYNTI